MAARSFTPQDGYALMTAIARQATGQQALTVINTNQFVTAGETLMASGTENVYNALGVVMGRLFVAARDYQPKLDKMNSINSGTFSNRIRKVSFYSRDPQASGYYNTDLYTNLADGYDGGDNGGASVKSQWEQRQALPFQMDFHSQVVFDFELTQYEEQINIALRDPVELAHFVAGMLTEHGNDIAQVREAFNRMIVLTRIGQTYLYQEGAGWTHGAAHNLTAEFNAKFGTTYTSAQLRSTYLKEFLAFLTAEIRKASDYLTERSTNAHLPMTKTVNGVQYSILRHTPKDRQLLYLFRPLLREAEALVLPEIFNPEYLDIEKSYEPVDFWQSNLTEADRPKIKVRVPYFNPATGENSDSGNLEFDYIVGLLTDVDGQMADFQLERALTTPVNARKGYRNTFLHFSKGALTDPTENAVLFYMADPTP